MSLDERLLDNVRRTSEYSGNPPTTYSNPKRCRRCRGRLSSYNPFDHCNPCITSLINREFSKVDPNEISVAEVRIKVLSKLRKRKALSRTTEQA